MFPVIAPDHCDKRVSALALQDTTHTLLPSLRGNTEGGSRSSYSESNLHSTRPIDVKSPDS